MKKIKYRREIDGLRALSVLAVVLFHFDMFSITGGFYGVDVFFVISGYLISSLLFAEIDKTGTLSISRFYLRRTRRILPALLVVCLLTYFIFALFVHDWQSPFPHFGDSLLATLFSVSNIFFWQNAGYFAIDAWAEPLLHTWSLGVEEQFYLVIPLLLYWLSRATGEVGRRKRYIIGFFIMAVLSFSLCRYGRDLVGGDFIFYMLPSRMWELLIGVLVALLLRRHDLTQTRWPLLNNTLAFLGLGVMVYGFFSFHESTRIAEKALLITSGAALFLLFTNENTIVGKIFTSRPMRFTGNISYSWYLWHWPLTSLAVMAPVRFPSLDPMGIRIALLVASYGLAYLSWKYVETPFRHINSWKQCIKPLAPLFVLLVCIGVANTFHVFGTKTFAFEHRTTGGFHLREKNDSGALGVLEKTKSFVLIGNSHADAVAPAIDNLAKQYRLAGLFNYDGLITFMNMRTENQKEYDISTSQLLKEYLEENKNYKNIILVARLDHIWVHSANGNLYYKGAKLPLEKVEEVYTKELTSFLSLLASKGRSVWVMEQVPRAKVDPTIATRVKYDYTEPIGRETHNKILSSVVKNLDLPNLKAFSVTDYFVRDDLIRFTAGNKLLYYDADHLSVEGAFHIQKAFLPIFDAISENQ